MRKQNLADGEKMPDVEMLIGHGSRFFQLQVFEVNRVQAFVVETKRSFDLTQLDEHERPRQ